MTSHRRVARALVAPGATVDELIAATEAKLGRKVQLRYGQQLPEGFMGVSTPGPPGGDAVIAIAEGVSADRVPYVIAHEVAHLLLHNRDAARSNYDDIEEWDAEMLGTLLVQRMRRARLADPSRCVR